MRDVTYALRSDVRGKYTIGPLTIRLTDPFGMCELTRAFTAIDTLVVTPVIWPLPQVRVTGGWNGTGESRGRSIAATGDDDVATRQYRQGDDLRRIHWRTTARTGELQVRREEQPWQASAVLMLDTRASAHRGDGPGSSFEYACSAVGSIGVHLLRGGYTVRLGPGLVDPRLSGVDIVADQTTLLDQLAVASVARSPLLPSVEGWRGGSGLFVAVLGALTLDEANQLAHATHAVGGNLAVLLDTASWTSLAPRVRASADEALDAITDVLLGAGWRVARAGHGTVLPSLWPQLASAGPATRPSRPEGMTPGAPGPASGAVPLAAPRAVPSRPSAGPTSALRGRR
jgi:hypothetical protein